MSLKFGLYLVEQGIITCDQFCGLVKIQQESNTSLSTIAIQKNFMTIKQVTTVLERQENTGSSFIDVALQSNFVDEADVKKLRQFEELSRPTIRKIIANVGLMTERQVNTLFAHYEKMAARGTASTNSKTAPAQTPSSSPGAPSAKPPQPKFRQRPVIVQQEYSTHYE